MRKIKSFFNKIYAYIKSKNLFTVVIISVCGGVPGVITIYNWITDKPKFTFHIESFSNGITTPPSPPSNFYLITGAVYNSGTLPLFPVHFILKAKFDDTTIESEAIGINDALLNKINNTSDSGGAITIRTGKLTSDLMQTVRVNAKDTQYGILFFPIEYMQKDISDPKSFDLTCVDLAHKEYTIHLNLKNFQHGSNRYIPKIDMNFK